MRPESAPQYALGKKNLSFYAAKMSGKNSAVPKIISFFCCERKKNKQVLSLSKQRKIRVDTKIEF